MRKQIHNGPAMDLEAAGLKAVSGKPAATENPLESLPAFRSALTGWFTKSARDFPWRRTSDPYSVLVSELMLQQTRVETVLKRGFYERWLARFPTVQKLAEAADDELLKAWEGLGYYRRAQHLRAAARVIVEKHGGEFPRSWVDIRALPGVGNYTAGAVAAFAYGEPAAMVDGNVGRVLSRLFDYQEPVDGAAGKKQLEAWSRSLVDPLHAREFQGGMMELGQTICARQSPACSHCPVARFCQVRNPEELPVKKEAVKIERVDEWVLWMRQGSRVYLERETGSRRKGLWRLPVLSSAPGGEVILRIRYPITRYQVTMHVLRASIRDLRERTGGTWFGEPDLAAVALASPDRRAVERLLKLEQEGDLWMETEASRS